MCVCHLVRTQKLPYLQYGPVSRSHMNSACLILPRLDVMYKFGTYHTAKGLTGCQRHDDEIDDRGVFAYSPTHVYLLIIVPRL